MAGYKAIVPLVIAKETLGRDVYIYEGQPVPEHVTQESIDHLLEGEYIALIEEPPTEPTAEELEAAAKAAAEAAAADQAKLDAEAKAKADKEAAAKAAATK